MANLPREYLEDISTQRFQENVARQNNKLSKTISDNADTISQIQSQLSDQASSYIDLVYSLNTLTSATVSMNHNLGVIPTGWYAIDVTAPVVEDYSITRSAWTTTSLTLYAAGTVGTTITCKIRVFK